MHGWRGWVARGSRGGELDRFEGAEYQRILVPFYSTHGSRTIGYLYAAAQSGLSPDRRMPLTGERPR